MTTDTSLLFQPLQIKGKTLRNRIVLPPMVVKRDLAGEDGRTWYGQRAAGGVGLVIVEATQVGLFGDTLTAENLRRRSQQARLTTDFLKRELDQAEAALRDQDRSITEFKERHRGELPGELEANLGRLERLQQQRQSLALQIAESSNRITLLAQGKTPEHSRN